MLRNNGRRLLYSAGYAAALVAARADLDALTNKFQRGYEELIEEVEKLRHQVRELRALAGLRDPTERLN
jgi:phage shock protein A